MKITAAVLVALVLAVPCAAADDAAAPASSVLAPADAPAAIPPAPAPLPADVTAVPSLGTYLRGVPADLKASGAAFASGRIFPWALAGTAATALAFTVDDEVREWFLENDPLGGQSDIGDVLGQGYTHALVAGSYLAYGHLGGKRREADIGMAVSEALVVNSLLTVTLKQVVGRERPDDGADNSFPSGHASSTAALSASLSAMYDWRPAVAVPLGALTLFVAASRLEDDVHWFSDVVAGMALGGVVGASVGEAWRHGKAREWAVLPWTPGAGGAGLVVVRAF